MTTRRNFLLGAGAVLSGCGNSLNQVNKPAAGAAGGGAARRQRRPGAGARQRTLPAETHEPAELEVRRPGARPAGRPGPGPPGRGEGGGAAGGVRFSRHREGTSFRGYQCERSQKPSVLNHLGDTGYFSSGASRSVGPKPIKFLCNNEHWQLKKIKNTIQGCKHWVQYFG